MSDRIPSANDSLSQRLNISTRRVLWVTGGLFGMILLSFSAIAVSLATWLDDRPITDPETQWQHNQSTPGVQPNQAIARQQYERQMAQQLTSYRWQDDAHTIAQIPIDRAIDVMSRKQLASPWKTSLGQGDSDD